MQKTILSGIQPSGNLTIGNYLGALRQWVELQNTSNEYKSFFMIADLHALTVPQDPKTLRAKILEVAKIYLACGIDPKKSVLFVQSHVRAHAELGWILGCITKIAELERMTQFKDKIKKHKDAINSGLFTYPALMAADILLYQTDLVPVGDDQTQHLELARDLAERFNKMFGQTFKLPKIFKPKQGARIMGLDDPLAKMSKSSDKAGHYIALLDSEKEIEQKIKRAVTDSGTEIKSGTDKPALTNLLTIFSGVTGRGITEIEKDFKGQGYGAFKLALAEAINKFVAPIRERVKQTSDAEVLKILHSGAENANEVAQNSIKVVRERVGLL